MAGTQDFIDAAVVSLKQGPDPYILLVGRVGSSETQVFFGYNDGNAELLAAYLEKIANKLRKGELI